MVLYLYNLISHIQGLKNVPFHHWWEYTTFIRPEKPHFSVHLIKSHALKLSHYFSCKILLDIDKEVDSVNIYTWTSNYLYTTTIGRVRSLQGSQIRSSYFCCTLALNNARKHYTSQSESLGFQCYSQTLLEKTYKIEKRDMLLCWELRIRGIRKITVSTKKIPSTSQYRYPVQHHATSDG
jgi:hypothetical protein